MTSEEKVLKEADLGYESALDVFQTPVSNVGLQDCKYVQYRATNQFSTEGNVKFRIPAAGATYLDLSDIYVRTTVRIVRSDGTKVPKRPAGDEEPEGEPEPTAGDEGAWSIGVSNSLSDSLWHQVELRLNDTSVVGGMTGYCYGAMLNTLLEEKETSDEELQCAMFYKDTAGYMETNSLMYGGNEGFRKRAKLLEGSRSVEVQSKLDLDVFKTKKFLLNGISVDLTLHPTSSAFRLITVNKHDKDYVLEIQDICLIVRQVLPTPPVLIGHQEILKSGLSRARYFYMKEDLRKFSIGRGLTSFFAEDAFQSRVPHSLAIAFIAGDSFVGNYNRNPYLFHHYFLSTLNVSLSGCPTSRGPLHFDFSRGRYLQGFADLYGGKTKGPANSQRITLEEYAGGYSLFVVPLSPQTGENYYPPARTGSVRIELRFSKPLPESIIMLCRVTYPACLELDHERNVYLS